MPGQPNRTHAINRAERYTPNLYPSDFDLLDCPCGGEAKMQSDEEAYYGQCQKCGRAEEPTRDAIRYEGLVRAKRRWNKSVLENHTGRS